jgi:AP-4 complex subunit mu-1
MPSSKNPIHINSNSSSRYRINLLQLKATFAKEITATLVDIKFVIPKSASSVGTEIVKNQGNQRAEYKESSKTVEWNIKKMMGGSEYTLVSKISLPQASVHQAQKETGPINLSFEIPMLSLSGLQIKLLKVLQ